MTGAWVAVGRVADIARLGARRARLAGIDVAIFRTADDRIFALEDRCPHRTGPLSQGIVHDTAVTCPLHGWVIDLEKAEARDPDAGCVRRFESRIDNGVIELLVPAVHRVAAE